LSLPIRRGRILVRRSAATPDTDNRHHQDDNVNDNDEGDASADTGTVCWNMPVGFRVQMLAGWRV